MDHSRISQIDLKTPFYLIDRDRLEGNCRILSDVSRKTGCRILLALKAFAMFSLFPLIRKYLHGTCASGLYEARLGREMFGGEVHTYSPAFRQDEFENIVRFSDSIIFNSWKQWKTFEQATSGRQVGLRINPQYSEVKTPLYNPCIPKSRLGILSEELKGKKMTGISGLHFHVMCEQDADTLQRVLSRVESKFGLLLPELAWISFGGGHNIAQKDYDIPLLCSLIDHFQNTYGLRVYLEPGETVALGAGYLITTVLDIVQNEEEIAILDTSAEAHMPDVLAMPYRPEIYGGREPGELPYTYRLAGNTCLAGDIMGDYSFSEPLFSGRKLVFTDMAAYTMVKNSTFNGINLPSIAVWDGNQETVEVVRAFGYDDFHNRLS